VFSRVARQSQQSDDRFLLLFTVRHRAGSLGRAIDVIGETGFNLRALKSRPTQKSNWSYYFFAEGEGNLGTESGRKMLAELQGVCESVVVLGTYPCEVRLKDSHETDILSAVSEI
jgi:chorismate mutase/prephenate dehydratase